MAAPPNFHGRSDADLYYYDHAMPQTLIGPRYGAHMKVTESPGNEYYRYLPGVFFRRSCLPSVCLRGQRRIQFVGGGLHVLQIDRRGGKSRVAL
jgi:hypothetical protein